MPKYETKLKLGRKLDEVDAATASDNQVSVLFRYDEQGQDRHVSFSVESDAMTAEDVESLLALLERRGVFTKANSKTWVSQPQASEGKFGATRAWQDADIEQMAQRISTMIPGAGGVKAPSGGAEEPLARLREAERRVAEMERALGALKQALREPTPPPAPEEAAD